MSDAIRVDTGTIPYAAAFGIAKAVYKGIRREHQNPAYEAEFRAWLKDRRGSEALAEYDAMNAAYAEAMEEEAAREALRQELRRKLEALG